jgi:hypothetical protein
VLEPRSFFGRAGAPVCFGGQGFAAGWGVGDVLVGAGVFDGLGEPSLSGPKAADLSPPPTLADLV